MSHFSAKILIGLICFLVISINTNSQNINKHYNDVSAKIFRIKIYEFNNEIIIDVRTKKEFEESKISEAILAENSKILNQISDTLDFDTPILIYCEYGDRSITACELLSRKGFKHLYNLKNGLIDWRKMDYKFEE